MLKLVVLKSIQILRKLFYNTPIHRSPLANRVYERLFRVAIKPGESTTVEYLGSKFTLSTDDITILPSLLNGEYEKLEFSVLLRLLTPGTVVVDVGANIGLHTVTAAKAVGPLGRVFSFEPEPGNFASLQRNIELNSCSNVTAVQSAVGSEDGEMTLYLVEGSIGTHSLLAASPGQRTISVPVVTLDGWLETQGSTPKVLKVDVEGYELAVLRGARATLDAVDHLFFEFNQAATRENFSIKELVEVLAPFPHLYNMDERKAAVVPFELSDFESTSYANILAAKAPYTAGL